MAGSVAERRSARPNVGPVIVCLSDVQVSSIFCSVVVRVANERSFPVIMDVGVGHGHPL